MAEQIIPLLSGWYDEGLALVRWAAEGSARPSIDPDLRDDVGNTRLFGLLDMYANGSVTLRIASSTTDPPAQPGHDLSSDFETSGSLEITAGTETVLVEMAGADLREPYVFFPSNSAEVTAFYNAVFPLSGNPAATLIIRDFVPVAPSWTDDTGDAINGTVGTAISDVVVPETDEGNPDPTYAVVGDLPAGVTFNVTTRVLSFDEDAIEAGSGTISIRATNSVDTADWTVAYTFQLPVADAPAATISAGSEVNEGGTIGLTFDTNGGLYDVLAVAWSDGAEGGTFSAQTAMTIYTAPAVVADDPITITGLGTVTGTGVNARSGTSDTVTVEHQITVRNVPVLSSDVDSIWRLFDRDTAPPTPVGGTNVENHTPAGWTRVEPNPTETQAVWLSQRIRNFSDSDFLSAAAWQDPDRTADELLTLSDIILPEGREIVGTGSLITVPADGDVYDGDATVEAGADPPALGDGTLNVTRVYVTGRSHLRVSQDGTGDAQASWSTGGSLANYQIHVQTAFDADSQVGFGSADIDAVRSRPARLIFGVDLDPDGVLDDVAALSSGDRVLVFLTRPAQRRIAGIGTTVVSGASSLTRIEPASVRIAGIGATAVTGASSLTRIEPASVRIAGIGTTVVSGASSLTRQVAPRRIAGIGSTTVSGASSLTRIEPASVRIAGIGTTVVSGESGLTRVEPDIGSSEFNIGNDLALNNIWEGALLIAPRYIENGGVGWLRRVARSGTSIQIRLSSTQDGDPNDAGPEFTTALKEYLSAFTFTDGAGETVTLPGPENDTNSFSDLDSAEPYFWTPPASAGWGAWVDAATGEITFVLDDGFVGTRIAGIGSTTVSGASSLTRIEPASVRIAGIGTTVVSGASSLTRQVAPRRIAGIGTTVVSGSSVLERLPGPRRIAGIGTTVVSGASTLTRVEPGQVRIAGIGTTVVSGTSSLTRVQPDPVRIAGIGSTTVLGASSLTTVMVVRASIARISGIGSTVVRGVSLLWSGEFEVEATEPVDFWPHRIQWSEGFRETYAFRTSVIAHRRGNEQRIAQRTIPRIAYDFMTWLDAADLRLAFLVSAYRPGALIHFPHPRESARLESAAAEGASSIEVDEVPGWLTPGAAAFLGAGGAGEPLQVGSVVGTTLDLDEPLSRRHGAAEKVFRGVPGRFSEGPEIRALTSRAGLMPLQVDGDPIDNWHVDLPDMAPVVLGEREYFDLAPNWASGVTFRTVNTWEDIDVQRGAVNRVRPVPFQIRTARYSYLMHTPERIERVLGLFYRSRGRQKAFYLSSGTHDLQPSAALAAGSRTFTLPGKAAAEVYGNSKVFERLRFLDSQGAFERAIEEIAVSGENSRVTLDDAFPRTVALDDLKMVSWINRVRFESDQLTVDWRTDGVAETTLTVRTLEDEDPEDDMMAMP